MLKLRPYQTDVINAVYDHLRNRDDNPCAVVPTAGGKTPIMATICKDAVQTWGGRVLILAHVKELLEQTAEKLRVVCPSVNFGIYSASLKRRDTDNSVIIAGIQSVFKRACELDAFDLMLVDEAHLIPLEGDGMYRRFLADAKVVNPHLRVVGFTATPYRLKSGSICTADSFLNHICFEVGVRELIDGGFLCPLISKGGRSKADVSGLHVRGGEFVADEVEHLMDQDELVRSACEEIVVQTVTRKACLIFASSIKHGQHIVDVLQETHGIHCGFVTGETPTAERDEILQQFKSGKLKYLCNVNVLTTGFDAPNIDCVALLRPTMSPGLYYQMVGRGFRLHPDKDDCLVLDFGGNVLRHGPVDAIEVTTNDRGDGSAPAKECPHCQTIVAAGFSTCPACGFEFPPPDRKQHEPKASEESILSGQVTKTEYEVHDVYYHVHEKKNANEGDPKTMRVDYQIGLDHWQSEWVCIEHSGYAQQKARAWWNLRSHHPFPHSAKQAVGIADGGGLAFPLKITVRSVAGEKFDRIVNCELAEIPTAVIEDSLDVETDALNLETNEFGDYQYNPDEIPF